jgi:hypothetical protein
VGEHPLVDLAHLPGAGEHAAAVDHRADPERGPVLGGEQLAGELGGAVKGPRPVQREALRHAGRPDPGALLVGVELETGLCLAPRRLVQRLEWVDTTRRDEDELGRVAPGQLQAVPRSHEVAVEHVGGVARGAGDRGRLGRALNHGVHGIEGEQVGGVAHVAVDETDPRVAQARQVELRPAPLQVVERHQLPLGPLGGKRHREVRADEPRAPGD